MPDIKKSWRQWVWISLIVFGIIGIMFPIVGVIALLCMLAPVVTAFWGGRTWCGYFCPRGSFYNHFLAKITLKLGTPRFLKERWFKVTFLVLLMGAFMVQILFAWGSLVAVGYVFVRMVLTTTLLGILLGVFYNHRTWCVICPMGTMAHYVAGLKKVRERLKHVTFVKDQCINCKLCSRYCPIGIDVSSYRKHGRVENGDCLKCWVCIEKCPKQSLYVA